MLPGRIEADYLRQRQYRTSENLDARISLHRRFSRNSQGFFPWLFDHFNLPGNARVLEVGCGSGQLWKDVCGRIPIGWDIILTDFSVGMLEGTRSSLGDRFRFLEADVQELPFPDNSFDGVIANFMLYHVSDSARALGELHRVLQPGGRLYAATNGSDHMCEIYALIGAPSSDARLLGGEAFSLENGAQQLSPHFDCVRQRRYEDGLDVTDAESLVAYIESMGPMVRSYTDRLSLEMRIHERIDREGLIRVTKDSGFFEGWRGDGQRSTNRDAL